MVDGKVLRLGGLAGLGVGLFILPFAVSDAIIGGLFAPEVLHGSSGEAWLQRIGAHPDLARFAMALPIVGFALMLVIGWVLYRLVADRHWAGTLGLAGYLVGVPLAVSTFASANALVGSVLPGGQMIAPEAAAEAMPLITFEMQRFMLVNFAIGPLFIIVTGNTSMALAAWRASTLPAWLGAWGMVNGAIMLLGIASVRWPVLEAAQIAGPLTMLWFMTTGTVLLRRSGTKEPSEPSR